MRFVHAILEAVDAACPKDDPSPIGMALVVEAAAQVIEDESLVRAAKVVAWEYGDWAGGRVEPRAVAERIIYLYEHPPGHPTEGEG